jgi:hypothetical protein
MLGGPSWTLLLYKLWKLPPPVYLIKINADDLKQWEIYALYRQGNRAISNKKVSPMLPNNGTNYTTNEGTRQRICHWLRGVTAASFLFLLPQDSAYLLPATFTPNKPCTYFLSGDGVSCDAKHVLEPLLDCQMQSGLGSTDAMLHPCLFQRHECHFMQLLQCLGKRKKRGA